MEKPLILHFKEYDKDEHLFYGKISLDEKFVIGVWPTIYGFRVRATYERNKFGYNLDYCCGGSIADVEMIYSAVLTVLMHYQTFEVFPKQNIKPMNNDPDCWVALLKLIGSKDIEQVRTPHIHEMKAAYLKRDWNL